VGDDDTDPAWSFIAEDGVCVTRWAGGRRSDVTRDNRPAGRVFVEGSVALTSRGADALDGPATGS
jgi:hypothetical protein